MHNLVNTFADVLTKPGKPVSWDIMYKIDLLDTAKLIPHYRQKIMREICKKFKINLKEYLEKE